MLRGPGRAAGERDPRRQQRPRPRHRPPGRQAHARGAARPRAHARAVRGDDRRRLPDSRRCLGSLGSLTRWLLLPWLRVPLAVRRHRDGPHPHRRAVAQPGARADRDAAARVLRAARGRLLALRHRRREGRAQRRMLELRACAGTVHGLGASSRARAAAVRAHRRATASSAAARRRRWSPTTASASSACSGARALPAVLGRRARALSGAGSSTRAARSPTCPQALAAIDLALWDLAGRRAGRPVAALLASRRGRAVRGQRDDRGDVDRAGGRRRPRAPRAQGFAA